MAGMTNESGWTNVVVPVLIPIRVTVLVDIVEGT